MHWTCMTNSTWYGTLSMSYTFSILQILEILSTLLAHFPFYTNTHTRAHSHTFCVLSLILHAGWKHWWEAESAQQCTNAWPKSHISTEICKRIYSYMYYMHICDVRNNITLLHSGARGRHSRWSCLQLNCYYTVRLQFHLQWSRSKGELMEGWKHT